MYNTSLCLSPGCENKQADVIFIIDASGSIWAPDFAKQLRFVRGIVRHFDVSDRATNFAILSFSDTTQIEYSLDDPQDRSSIAHAIVSVIQVRRRQLFSLVNVAGYSGSKLLIFTRLMGGLVHV